MSSSGQSSPSRRRLALALMVTTLAALAIELNFARLVSLLFVAADAYWVIALALLGFGIGGALVAVGADRLERCADWLMPTLMIGVGLSGLLPVLLFRSLRPELGSQLSPARPLLIFWIVSASCLLTFLLTSTFISLIFARHRAHIGRLYSFDLLGAGLGCLIFVLLLRPLGLELSLVVMAGTLLAGSLLLVPGGKRAFGIFWVLALLAIVGSALRFRGPSELLPFVARELRMLYEYQPDAELEFQGWDPVARIDIVSVPGKTLALPDTARYKLLTQDGGAPSVLLAFDRPVEDLEFPDRSLHGAAYWGREVDSALIIGPGGGPDVVTALHYGTQRITAVELNATTIEAVTQDFLDFTGGIFRRPEVELVHDDGRHFVSTTEERYDVIQLTGVDTVLVGAGGNLSENYLYTLEAFEEYFDHLSDDGVLAVMYPHLPVLGERALAMLLRLGQERELEHPDRHIVVTMSGGYLGLLLKRSPWTREEISVISGHFDQPLHGLLLPLYYELWGQYLGESGFPLYTNRAFFEQQALLVDPFTPRSNVYSQRIDQWLSDPDAAGFWSSLGDFEPATDDRPFFFAPIRIGRHFAKRILWLVVPTLAFILAPLALFKRRGLTLTGAAPLALYFACLGLAFIAMEMVLLQKFVLLLGHPGLTFAVVLGGLLVSTGLGSLSSERWADRPRQTILWSVAGLALGAVLFALFSGPATAAALRTGLAVRILLTLAFVAPFGLLMGQLFPSGIRLLGDREAGFVAWAWGINGSASVIGTLMSLFLAIELGFTRLMLLAVATYLVAGLAAVRSARWSAKQARLRTGMA